MRVKCIDLFHCEKDKSLNLHHSLKEGQGSVCATYLLSESGVVESASLLTAATCRTQIEACDQFGTRQALKAGPIVCFENKNCG